MKKLLLIFWLGTLFLIGFFWIYFPTLTRYRDLKFEEEKLGKEITDLVYKIEDLREEKNLLVNDREYIEKVIRQDLGLVKPGETVYKFVEDEPEKAEELPEAEEPPKAINPEPEVEEPPSDDLEPDELPEFRVVEEADPPLPLPAVKPLKLQEVPARKLFPRTESLAPVIPRKTPISSASTLRKPIAALPAAKPAPQPRPVLHRKFPEISEPTPRDSFDEDESLWGRFTRKVSDVVGEIQEEWMPQDEDEPSTFPPLPSARPVSSRPQPRAVPIRHLPNRISQPLPVSQPKPQIPLSSASVYPRQETR